jgi:hypothetical protein
MMAWFLVPLAAVAVIGLLCANVKVGFIVSDATQNTGFDTGFYMMTVVGLTAAEITLVVWLLT